MITLYAGRRYCSKHEMRWANELKRNHICNLLLSVTIIYCLLEQQVDTVTWIKLFDLLWLSSCISWTHLLSSATLITCFLHPKNIHSHMHTEIAYAPSYTIVSLTGVHKHFDHMPQNFVKIFFLFHEATQASLQQVGCNATIDTCTAHKFTSHVRIVNTRKFQAHFCAQYL